jgi:hypothetical protein
MSFFGGSLADAKQMEEFARQQEARKKAAQQTRSNLQAQKTRVISTQQTKKLHEKGCRVRLVSKKSTI